MLHALAQTDITPDLVLNAGNTCHRHNPPRQVADMVAIALLASLRQRVLVEASITEPSPCLLLDHLDI